ncbi:hypothetical protein [Paraliomyxa miuraensis]|uniref:hypothetical protein n=1 Tax=Paraliomyxa miuraensis TaxID=376150 RepID=UPI00225C05D8|nr:hypothetical protein [Paraliomyxa miuraensis]MCX4242606.1 hypothetical protein [Paraliomyxa miuraensis]
MKGSTIVGLATSGWLGLAGCGGSDGGRVSDSGSGIASVSAGTADGSGTGSGSADGLDSLDSLDDGATNMTGVDDGITPDDGCKKVDFLFVIDNSVSMEGEQAALVGAFPGFMDTIQSTLPPDSDYHVMVADTDAWGRCNTANPWTGHSPDHSTCNGYIEQTVFDECDQVMGAGVVHPAGEFASNTPCQLQGGHRYIEASEPDLGAAFSCMAQVGTAGHPSERPMDAMVAALAPGINGPGGCNEGFLRDDALLVVTFMSDDPNYEDADGPQPWYDAVVQYKLGDPTAIVVLGLTPAWEDCGSGGPPKGEHWAEFIAMFGDHGIHGNVCGTAQEYVDFFQMAVSTIGDACNEYVPPG